VRRIYKRLLTKNFVVIQFCSLVLLA